MKNLPLALSNFVSTNFAVGPWGALQKGSLVGALIGGVAMVVSALTKKVFLFLGAALLTATSLALFFSLRKLHISTEDAYHYRRQSVTQAVFNAEKERAEGLKRELDELRTATQTQIRELEEAAKREKGLYQTLSKSQGAGRIQQDQIVERLKGEIEHLKKLLTDVSAERDALKAPKHVLVTMPLPSPSAALSTNRSQPSSVPPPSKSTFPIPHPANGADSAKKDGAFSHTIEMV